jgi:hypothetical protein
MNARSAAARPGQRGRPTIGAATSPAARAMYRLEPRPRPRCGLHAAAASRTGAASGPAASYAAAAGPPAPSAHAATGTPSGTAVAPFAARAAALAACGALLATAAMPLGAVPAGMPRWGGDAQVAPAKATDVATRARCATGA